MAQTALRPWTLEEFFAWDERQEGRHELVGGFPVRMMSGTTNRHSDIVANILGELRNRLRGSKYRPFSGDGPVQTLPRQVRRPDAGVDCGHRDPDAYVATDPRLVVEVLSPSTRDFDTFEKLAGYKAVESLDSIIYVEPNRAEVAMWLRNADRAWTRLLFENLGDVIPLPSIGIELPLAEIYDRVEIDMTPRPVPPSGR